MEGQRERTSSRRRQRRKAKNSRNKAPLEPVLIAARRPDSPLLRSGFRNAVASAEPKRSSLANVQLADAFAPSSSRPSPGHRGSQAEVHPAESHRGEGFDEHRLAALSEAVESDDVGGAREERAAGDDVAPGAGLAVYVSTGVSVDAPREVVRRRAVRIVKAAEQPQTLDNREQRLLDRLMRSQGRAAISRAADDLWESKFVAPKQQEVQIQLLEHENEQHARDAVFAIAELLQREAPVQRPVLDQRLRRLEEFAEDPITRDAARALRRSMRAHHGM